MTNFDYSYRVCACKKVSLGEIVHAIEKKNAINIKNIQDITDAGTACKCCISSQKDFGTPKMQIYLQDILKKYNGQ